jgi:hypothetical protein
MERHEQLATTGVILLTTTITSSKQSKGQTTRAVEATTSKDAVNVANTEVPEQVPEQVSEQEAPEQVVPEQSLLGTLSEGQVPETNQGVPKLSTATMSSTQGGLPDAATRGKSVAMLPTIRLSQEQEQAGAKQATESDDDVIKEIQGHPQDGWQHVYICRECEDHCICHEELSIDEETERVERAARRLIREVQVSVLMKMASTINGALTRFKACPKIIKS